MSAIALQAVRTDLRHAISAIQSEWSPRERQRRQRLAGLRQQRLAQMLSPLQRAEAFPCFCDMDESEHYSHATRGSSPRRSQRFVLVEG
jgi:hypothetical protein